MVRSTCRGVPEQDAEPQTSVEHDSISTEGEEDRSIKFLFL